MKLFFFRSFLKHLELQEQDGLWSVIRHFEQVIALAHLRFSEDTDSPTVQDKTVARTGLPVPDLPDTFNFNQKLYNSCWTMGSMVGA